MNNEQELREALAFILSQDDMKDFNSARKIAFATLKRVYGPEWLPECQTFADVDTWMQAELDRITQLCIDDAKRQAGE